jgi:hypothetical protein
VSNTGAVYMLLQSEKATTSTTSTTHKIILITCVLTHSCPHEAIISGSDSAVLSIQITDDKQVQDTRQLGVTNDGMWLASPRRYCDECDCGIATHSQLRHALQTCSQVSKTMYDQRVVFTRSWFELQHASKHKALRKAITRAAG